MGKPLENGGLMGFYGMYPLVMTNIANWKITIERVDLSIKHGYFPVRYVKLPEGKDFNHTCPPSILLVDGPLLTVQVHQLLVSYPQFDC